MIHQLMVYIDKFEGQECQTRCFAHILNLIAKSIIQQFDIPKAQANKVFDKATTALIVLAGDIDMEEQKMGVGRDDGNDNDNSENVESWVDKQVDMTVEQLAALNKSVQLVRLMLVKVCIIFYPLYH